MSLVIDASVFVAAALAEDEFHLPSSRFLQEVRLAGEVIYEPVLVLAEVAGVISRTRKDHAPGDVAALRIENFPRTRLRIADGAFARRAARVAARHALTGADAHYLALAMEYDCTLVTWDHEIIRRTPASTACMTPETWLCR